MVDYLDISQQALFPGLILFVVGWLFGPTDILTQRHVVGMNKFTLHLSIPFSVLYTCITFVPLCKYALSTVLSRPETPLNGQILNISSPF